MNTKIVWFLVTVVVIGLGVGWMASRDVEQLDVQNLPWQVNSENAQETKVLSLRIGAGTLLEMVETLKKIPELAAFIKPDKSKLIEGYFSKVRVGVLQASFAVEVDTENVDLSAYARFKKGGKPMPSGNRKFTLSKTGILGANALRVWKLAYLPSTNYSAEQILQFFGEPETKETITANVEYWYYPAKGLVITYDKDGREVFYYSARAEYKKLLRSIPKESKF